MSDKLRNHGPYILFFFFEKVFYCHVQYEERALLQSHPCSMVPHQTNFFQYKIALVYYIEW